MCFGLRRASEPRRLRQWHQRLRRLPPACPRVAQAPARAASAALATRWASVLKLLSDDGDKDTARRQAYVECSAGTYGADELSTHPKRAAMLPLSARLALHMCLQGHVIFTP